MLHDNCTRFAGRWYSFRVGAVLFISLDADDVVYQDTAAFVAGSTPLVPATSTSNALIEPGTSFYVRGYSGGMQTCWLEDTLRCASHEPGIDWIVVQMHQDTLSSSKSSNGSDKGIREAWLPLFDRYGVDAATGSVVDTMQPQPVVTVDPQDCTFDTRHGTDAREDAIWSTRRDAGNGYGIAVFDYEPNEAGGHTSITVHYYHAAGTDSASTSDYSLFETIVLSKPRHG